MKVSIVVFGYLLNTVTCYFCYWNSGCPYKYFSDKTPYNNVRGDIRDSIVKLKDCHPISIWALLTTGKSIPEDYAKSLNVSLAIRKDVITSYQNGKSSLCAQDIENLESWGADDRNQNKHSFLTDEGTQELTGIASRLRKAFPELLQNLKGNYKIAHTSGSLTEESAKSFIKGFQNERLNIEEASDNLVPFRFCTKYQNFLHSEHLHNEVEKYKKTAEYLAMKDRIQRRLGIDNRLSDDSVKSLYDLCRYTWSGIANKFSPWCALFTTEDLRALEYVGDLELYYKHGYGNAINGLLGGKPMADLLKTFQQAKADKGNYFTAYFTDVATLNMVATALDLFKDEIPLRAKRDPKRKWRNTKLSVFSANLIAVLNRCSRDKDIDHNVVFYWNEEPLRPICERGFCNWDEFEHKLNPFANITLEACDK